MKTSHIVIGGALIAGVAYLFIQSRKTATATEKPTILGALGGFISQIGAATSSKGPNVATTTTTARADANGLDITSPIGTEST